MASIPPFSEAHIESLARLLGECGSGSDMTRVLQDRGLVDNSRESTKWRRLYWVFLTVQEQYGCASSHPETGVFGGLRHGGGCSCCRC